MVILVRHSLCWVFDDSFAHFCHLWLCRFLRLCNLLGIKVLFFFSHCLFYLFLVFVFGHRYLIRSRDFTLGALLWNKFFFNLFLGQLSLLLSLRFCFVTSIYLLLLKLPFSFLSFLGKLVTIRVTITGKLLTWKVVAIFFVFYIFEWRKRIAPECGLRLYTFWILCFRVLYFLL